jgi:hypothetical protein
MLLAGKNANILEEGRKSRANVGCTCGIQVCLEYGVQSDGIDNLSWSLAEDDSNPS